MGLYVVFLLCSKGKENSNQWDYLTICSQWIKDYNSQNYFFIYVVFFGKDKIEYEMHDCLHLANLAEWILGWIFLFPFLISRVFIKTWVAVGGTDGFIGLNYSLDLLRNCYLKLGLDWRFN